MHAAVLGMAFTDCAHDAEKIFNTAEYRAHSYCSIYTIFIDYLFIYCNQIGTDVIIELSGKAPQLPGWAGHVNTHIFVN